MELQQWRTFAWLLIFLSGFKYDTTMTKFPKWWRATFRISPNLQYSMLNISACHGELHVPISHPNHSCWFVSVFKFLPLWERRILRIVLTLHHLSVKFIDMIRHHYEVIVCDDTWWLQVSGAHTPYLWSLHPQSGYISSCSHDTSFYRQNNAGPVSKWCPSLMRHIYYMYIKPYKTYSLCLTLCPMAKK